MNLQASGDPWSVGERQILVERGLFELASWAASIPDMKGETHAVLTRELRSQLAERLRGARAKHVERSAAYVIKMGRAFRQQARGAAT